MEAIIQYTLVLHQVSPSSVPDVKSIVRPLLERLITIDPMRKARYHDIAEQLDGSQ